MPEAGLPEHLPFDLEAEKCVLGSVLRDPQCATEVSARLAREDFYSPHHREIFSVLEALEERSSGSCDPVTVAHEIDRLGRSEELGGRPYLVELMESVPTVAFLENHLSIVRSLALRRELVRAAGQIQRFAMEGEEDVRQLLDRSEQLVFRVGDRLVEGQVHSARDLVQQHIGKILSEQPRTVGLATGFYDLDACMGFRPGDLVILASRPAMGKTALCLNLLERVALAGKRSVLLFSLEMPAEQIILRLLSEVSQVRHASLQRGRLGQAERAQITRAAGKLNGARIFVDDSSQPGLAELRAKARRLKRDGKLDLIVLDYLQLLHVPRCESRQQEIATISRTLKGMARELNVPVLALAQLNRKAEEREANRPRLSDLRESGAIEADADMVMLLFREAYYRETPENAGVAEVIVAKNRNGPTTTIRLRFTKELMRFENAVREPVA
ncbi:MAG: replicative DNA helicase [Planctomycetota bacterium]